MKRTRSHAQRRLEGLFLLLLAAALAGLLAYAGASRRMFTVQVPSLLRGRSASPLPATRGAQPDSVLRREVGSLRSLVAAAARGELLPPDPNRGLVVIDQGLVESLLKAQLPAEHLVAGALRVVADTVQVRFEDGLALVRIDGRVMPDGAPTDIQAALSVFGDLELAPRVAGAEALHMKVTINAVEAHRTEAAAHKDRVDRLVEAVGRARLEEFAALATELDVPVRWEYPVDIPGVGPQGPVRIDAASLAIGLRLAEVRALAGRLWLAVDLAVDQPKAAVPAPPVYTRSTPALETPATLRAEHARLHEALDAALAKDPVLSQATASAGDLTFVLPAGVITRLAEEVAVRYLDRVTLALENIRVTKEGEMHNNTLFGRVHSGTWKLDAELDGVHGVLRAGRPRIALHEGGRIGVVVPVHIENGSGAAALHFAWNSHGIANLVCRDFEVREQVAGAVVREEVSLVGEVTLTVEGDELRLAPQFERRQRLHVAPEPGAWDAARRALEAQDALFRCGLALKPDSVMAQLQEVVGRGFVVHLPASLFRPVRLPSVLAQSLQVAGREVKVAAVESALQTDPERALLALRLRVLLGGPEGAEAIEAPRRRSTAH